MVKSKVVGDRSFKIWGEHKQDYQLQTVIAKVKVANLQEL